MELKRITEEEMNAQGVVAAPDILNGTPAQNKAMFDRMVRSLVAPAVNACVDAIEEANGIAESKGYMEAKVYDPQGKKQDVFQYVEDQINGLTATTSYSKDETLAKETKTLFGLGADAVPDNVFGVLSRFQNGLGNEYVWAKTKETVSYTCTETVHAEPENTIYVAQYQSAPQTYYYADEFEYAEDGKTFVLKNPQSFSNAKNDYANANMYYVLKGKYVIMGMAENTSMFFYPQDCNIYNKTVDGYNSVVTSERHNFYNPKKEIAVESFGYVNSSDPNAYPVDDGYTYNMLGQLGGAARIATGSYIGTGTYGASNRNSITFDFEPKIVFVMRQSDAGFTNYLNSGGSISGFMFAINGVTTVGASGQKASSGSGSNAPVQHLTWGRKSLSWYVTGREDAYQQFNESGTAYRYIAIG